MLYAGWSTRSLHRVEAGRREAPAANAYGVLSGGTAPGRLESVMVKHGCLKLFWSRFISGIEVTVRCIIFFVEFLINAVLFLNDC